MNLHQLFLSNPSHVCHKWIHYFDIYEKHFERFRWKEFTMVEIGVDGGGSLAMWKEYFGSRAKIVGIDINQNCKQYENPEANVFVEIGNQSDTNFLQSVLDKHGLPDLILDDGSHRMNDLNATFDFLYPKLKDGGIYFVEDLLTCYMPNYDGGFGNPNTFIEKTKKIMDSLNMGSLNTQLGGSNKELDYFAQNTQCISCYDSIVVFDKKKQGRRIDVKTGTINLF